MLLFGCFAAEGCTAGIQQLGHLISIKERLQTIADQQSLPEKAGNEQSSASNLAATAVCAVRSQVDRLLDQIAHTVVFIAQGIICTCCAAGGERSQTVRRIVPIWLQKVTRTLLAINAMKNVYYHATQILPAPCWCPKATIQLAMLTRTSACGTWLLCWPDCPGRIGWAAIHAGVPYIQSLHNRTAKSPLFQLILAGTG